MALGAEQARVVRMVLSEVLLMVGTGLVVGLGLATVMTRFIAIFLYGLTSNDPLTLALAAAALVRSWCLSRVPARTPGVPRGPDDRPSGRMNAVPER